MVVVVLLICAALFVAVLCKRVSVVPEHGSQSAEQSVQDGINQLTQVPPIPPPRLPPPDGQGTNDGINQSAEQSVQDGINQLTQIPPIPPPRLPPPDGQGTNDGINQLARPRLPVASTN